MLESAVEKRLKRLENYGFKVLKLKTPGVSGVPDRMILMPKYAPGPPRFVELKRPGKTERPLQNALILDWAARGVTIFPTCDTVEKVDLLIYAQLSMAGWHQTLAGLWYHPRQAYDPAMPPPSKVGWLDGIL